MQKAWSTFLMFCTPSALVAPYTLSCMNHIRGVYSEGEKLLFSVCLWQCSYISAFFVLDFIHLFLSCLWKSPYFRGQIFVCLQVKWGDAILLDLVDREICCCKLFSWDITFQTKLPVLSSKYFVRRACWCVLKRMTLCTRACIQCKLASTSPLAGMHAQTFHASRIM
jgi:hypothetical protein